MRILLADAQPLLRDAIKASIETESDLDVVGTAADGVQAVEVARRECPDVVVLDLNLPNGDSLEAARQITRVPDPSRVLILADREDGELLLQSVEAGARGFLTRSSPLPELIDAVRRVGRGELGIPHHLVVELIDRLVARRRDHHDAAQVLSRLTRRERQVVALLADGADNDEIARALVISPETARSHVQNALRKLGVHSRLEAMAFVTRNGMLADLTGANGS
jgi:DNA-binding NarL/FixJ family response regulator